LKPSRQASVPPRFGAGVALSQAFAGHGLGLISIGAAPTHPAAGVAELVDARDLKSLGLCPCGFDPHRPHHVQRAGSSAFSPRRRLAWLSPETRVHPRRRPKVQAPALAPGTGEHGNQTPMPTFPTVFAPSSRSQLVEGARPRALPADLGPGGAFCFAGWRSAQGGCLDWCARAEAARRSGAAPRAAGRLRRASSRTKLLRSGRVSTAASSFLSPGGEAGAPSVHVRLTRPAGLPVPEMDAL
jgi:hypothetical protein